MHRLWLITSSAVLLAACTVEPTSTVPAPTAAPTTAPANPVAGQAMALHYTAGGDLLVETDTGILLFDLPDKRLAWSVPMPDGCCSAIVLNDRIVAAGSAVHVLETGTGQALYVLRGESISSLALSPDQTTLATGENARVRLWEAATGREIAAWETGDTGLESFPLTDRVSSVAFSPDGRVLYTANWSTGKVSGWDLASSTQISFFELTNTMRFKFTPDGSVVPVDFNQYGFEMRDPQTGSLQAVHEAIIGASGFVTFSADGSKVVVWGYRTGMALGAASVWALDTDTRIQEFTTGPAQPDWRYAALEPESATAALIDQVGKEVFFFDVATGAQVDSLPLP